jgi:hypothetical protein
MPSPTHPRRPWTWQHAAAEHCYTLRLNRLPMLGVSLLEQVTRPQMVLGVMCDAMIAPHPNPHIDPAESWQMSEAVMTHGGRVWHLYRDGHIVGAVSAMHDAYGVDDVRAIVHRLNHPRPDDYLGDLAGRPIRDRRSGR